MDWKLKLLLLLLASLGGCASAPSTIGSAEWIDPSQAVQSAAAVPNSGVTGVFYMTVKSTGITNRRLHLNSELDYRDQRNLSISVNPQAAEELAQALSAPPESALKDKRILVSGTAKRVRIDFTHNGLPTGKYYYQTHVLITKASQIKVL